MFRRNRISQLVGATLAVAALLLAVPAVSAESTPMPTVNINTGSASQIQLLPRIGPAVAQRVVEYREKNGDFKRLEDLMLVRGIGQRTFDGLKSYIVLSGETTAKEPIRVARGSASGAAKAPKSAKAPKVSKSGRTAKAKSKAKH